MRHVYLNHQGKIAIQRALILPSSRTWQSQHKSLRQHGINQWYCHDRWQLWQPFACMELWTGNDFRRCNAGNRCNGQNAENGGSSTHAWSWQLNRTLATLATLHGMGLAATKVDCALFRAFQIADRP